MAFLIFAQDADVAGADPPRPENPSVRGPSMLKGIVSVFVFLAAVASLLLGWAALRGIASAGGYLGRSM